MARHEAEEFATVITGILFEMNTQISALSTVLAAANDSGVQLMALSTHNLDIAYAGAGLQNVVREKLMDLITQYRVWVKALEDYRDGL